MNKEDLIKKYEGLEGPIADTVTVNRSWILESIEQLDEPQKPVVPQFVADWYEENKDNLEINIFNYVYIMNDNDNSTFKKWFVDSVTKPFQTLVTMHQFGYTVKKEKRYTVRLKYTDDYLVKTNNGDYRFYNNIYTNRRKHTRKEIEKARFGWMFVCEGIEVKEVE